MFEPDIQCKIFTQSFVLCEMEFHRVVPHDPMNHEHMCFLP